MAVLVAGILIANIHLTDSSMNTALYMVDHANPFTNISASSDSTLTLFCWRGLNPTYKSYFTSSNFYIKTATSEYKVFYGLNTSQVEDQAEKKDKFWDPQLLWTQSQPSNLRFNPFQDCCYGIVTAEPYELHLQYQKINLVLVFLSIIGLILFVLAPFLSRSTLAHYTVWASLSIFFSFFCLAFLLQKRFRQSFFSWVFLAYTLSLYLMSSTLYSLSDLLSPSTLPWVGGYCLVTGIISCAVLYRIGPPSHPRTLSLLQWAIQAASLVLVAMSSYNTRASITVSILVMLSSAVPVRSLCSWVDSLARISRRVRTEFITETQMQEQSQRETRLALEQLRRDCQRNQEEAWRIMTRLRDPGRFAEFVQGASDVTQEEVEEHRRVASSEEISDSTDCDTSGDTTDNESVSEFGHRFRCFLCNPRLLGHRFSCVNCLQES